MKTDAARAERNETKLVLERVDRDLERERATERVVRDPDCRAPRAHGDPHLGRALAEETSKLRGRVARERRLTELDRHSLEHAASMPKALNSAGHVDGKTHGGERQRELGELEATESRGPAELDAEAVTSDREPQLDGRLRLRARDARRGSARRRPLAKLR